MYIALVLSSLSSSIFQEQVPHPNRSKIENMFIKAIKGNYVCVGQQRSSIDTKHDAVQVAGIHVVQAKRSIFESCRTNDQTSEERVRQEYHSFL